MSVPGAAFHVNPYLDKTMMPPIMANAIGDQNTSKAIGKGEKWRSLGESNPCFSLERAAS